MTKSLDKATPDTSVIIEGLITKQIENGDIEINQLLIHEAVLAELEHQANLGKSIGFIGLDELNKLNILSKKYNFSIVYSGKRPGAAEIKYAGRGEIDAMIRQLAWEEDATLITADKVQSEVARARGMKYLLIKISDYEKPLKLESFFDSETMSVHLRENVVPGAKKGRPGEWKFVYLRKEPITAEEIKEISREIIEESNSRKNAFIEIEREGSTIVQLGRFRIVITRPPFSDGWEITAVRPVKLLTLNDYNLTEKLMKRISEQAEGILIAGSPGHGKSTFAQALAEYYASKDKIVKTIEAPRDLVLPDNITQYSISKGSPQEIQDILLLSRPDYTIFDEMRNTQDFSLFADMRLAGIGLAGVVHATNPIDAIQRFVGRIELGVIPQVIDTVVFIKNGAIAKVLGLQMVVKVPSGMVEADLARPVVVVTDFETKKLEYELYSYGEETVVIPVKTSEKSPSKKLAGQSIEREFKNYCDRCIVDVVSENKAIVQVPSEFIAQIIGKQGQNIEKIEKKLGISIDIQELKGSVKETQEKQSVDFSVKISKGYIEFNVDESLTNKQVGIYIDDDLIMTANVGKTGVLNIKKKHQMGKLLVNAVNNGEHIELKI
ncbi:MAG: PINc/VapC family ATPase [Nanoarchaeota archaeon]|nr:PINc/VapC family ATPase [Nanoarchaeota archaeon]